MPRRSITATIKSVLLETDVPDLLLARDVVGTTYLCCFIAREEEGDRFLAMPVSPNRLASFRAGTIDLRAVLLGSETGIYFDGRYENDNGEPLLHLNELEELPNEWLPDAGFLLTDVVGPRPDAEAVREAIASNSAAVICSFNPPEARHGVPRMDADDLAKGITWFQALVKYVHKKRVSGLPAAARRAIEPDAWVLQATAFSAGSFRVHFESKHSGGLLGATHVGVAMTKVDELLSVASLPADQQLEVLSQHKGHSVAALQQLLKFISKEKAGLTYSWADPQTAEAAGREVSPVAAEALCAVLEHRKELAVEEVKFTGEFIRVAEDRKTWRARDLDSQRQRHGALHAETPDLLRGIVIADVRYEFVCDERIQQRATGAMVPKLFLKSVNPQR